MGDATRKALWKLTAVARGQVIEWDLSQTVYKGWDYVGNIGQKAYDFAKGTTMVSLKTFEREVGGPSFQQGIAVIKKNIDAMVAIERNKAGQDFTERILDVRVPRSLGDNPNALRDAVKVALQVVCRRKRCYLAGKGLSIVNNIFNAVFCYDPDTLLGKDIFALLTEANFVDSCRNLY